VTSAAHSLKAPFPLLPSGDCWRSCRCSYASGQKAAWIGSEAAKAVLKYWKMETEADALALSICRSHKYPPIAFLRFALSTGAAHWISATAAPRRTSRQNSHKPFELPTPHERSFVPALGIMLHASQSSFCVVRQAMPDICNALG